MNDTRSKEIFEDLPVPKALLTMAVPTVMGQMIILIYSMADTFYVGRTGNPYMVAAASLILPVFNIALSVANLTGMGGGALVSRLLGAHREEEARRVCAFSVWVGICLAGLFSLGTLLFMRPLLTALGAGSETYAFARTYALCVIVCGEVPTVCSNILAAMVRSVGYSKQSGFGVMLGGVLNMGLDPLFMFVLFPKGMEILAAGVATCLSNCIACGYFLALVYRLRGGVLTLRADRLPDAASIKSVFAVGIPSAVATFLFDLDYVVLDKLMSAYGDLALAAIGIVLKIERFPLNTGIGICQAMMPLAAYNFASGNDKRKNAIVRTAVLSGLVIALLSILVYELFAQPLAGLFIDNAETAALAAAFLRVRILATPLMFLSFSITYVFNAYGEGRISMLLGCSRWAVFDIPMLFVLNRLMGMQGLVWAQAAGDILTVILTYTVYWRYEAVRGKKRAAN